MSTSVSFVFSLKRIPTIHALLRHNAAGEYRLFRAVFPGRVVFSSSHFYYTVPVLNPKSVTSIKKPMSYQVYLEIILFFDLKKALLKLCCIFPFLALASDATFIAYCRPYKSRQFLFFGKRFTDIFPVHFRSSSIRPVEPGICKPQ